MKVWVGGEGEGGRTISVAKMELIIELLSSFLSGIVRFDCMGV